MDKNTLIAYLKDKETQRNLWSCDYVDTSFDINPEDYISYAEADLRNTDEHRFINALGNTKRALDCQADRLLKLLGFYADARKELWGFPRKLFIHATNNYACRTIDQVGYVNWTDNPLFNSLGEPQFIIDNVNSKIIVKKGNLSPANAKETYCIEIGIRDPEYTEVMKCHLKKAEFR